MLVRNDARVNRLWREAAGAERVLSDPTYLVFDEWWGPLSDDFSDVVGREAANRSRSVHYGMRSPAPWYSTSWFGTDYTTIQPLVACWMNGSIVYAHAEMAEQAPCLGRNVPMVSRSTSRVCLLHFGGLKRYPAVAHLPDPMPDDAARRLAQSKVVGLTKDGMWLPIAPSEVQVRSSTPGMPLRGRTWTLVSGLSNRLQDLSSEEVAAYLTSLTGRSSSNLPKDRAAHAQQWSYGRAMPDPHARFGREWAVVKS
eukprot:Transcript_9105.p1 GENE.Transcript_9105~~Transcript_9105.p1  ORF type:complete len:254 (+),score=18.60 Transcript_9105:594-1355(+)